MIKLMIADDHAIMREGLKQLFALAGDVQAVAEAENGTLLLERLRQGDIDLLLMSMPVVSGDDLVARIRAHYPQLPILVLSMRNEVPIAQHALQSGANGYLTKDRDPETLLAAIRRVATGGRYIDAGLAEQILKHPHRCRSTHQRSQWSPGHDAYAWVSTCAGDIIRGKISLPRESKGINHRHLQGHSPYRVAQPS